MDLINKTGAVLPRGSKELLEAAIEENNLEATGDAKATNINERGLVTVELPYKGSIEVTELTETPIGSKFIYTTSKGDVELMSFNESELTLRVITRV